MKRIEFFNALEKELKKNEVSKIEDVLRDYEEIFISKMSKGKTEDEIIAELDSPTVIALAYKNTNSIDVKSTKKSLNSKIKFATIMRAILVLTAIYIAIEVIKYIKKVPFSWLLPMVFICITALYLIVVYTKSLNTLKKEEDDINNIEKKDI